MTTDPVQEYREAARRLEAATRHARGIMNRIALIERGLSADKWQRARLLPSHGPVLSNEGTYWDDLDLASWPTGDDIASAITDWHEAKRVAHDLWKLIPQEDRFGLSAPPA